MNVLSYHVFNGRQWLSDDEKTWTPNFFEAASFASAELAQDIADREEGDGALYVLACLGSK